MSDIATLTKVASLATPLPTSEKLQQTSISTQDSVDHPMPDQSQPQSAAGPKPSSKKYSCPHCQQTFTRQSNLKSHLVIHSQEKKFTCETCSSKFRRIHDLKRHLMLHTGERPFLCSKCGRRFARGDALIRHKKASGTCYVTFVAEDKADANALDKQMQLPPASSPQKKPLELEKQPQQKPQLSQSPSSGINSGSSILPSILNSTNTSANARSDSNISISLPPISNPTYQTASSLPFPSQKQLRKPSNSEERSHFHASQNPQPEVESPTSAPATPAGKDDVTTGQEQPPAAISLYAQQQIHKRSSISSITSPMPVTTLTKPTTALTSTTSSLSSSSSPTPINEPSTSFSNILSSPYTRSVSVVSPTFSHPANVLQPVDQETAKVGLPSSSPTTTPSISNTGSSADNANGCNNSRTNSISSNKPRNNSNSSNNNNNNNNNSMDNNAWQIIKMLENRVRALEERLNSSEGRVSFLENQLSSLR